jgi:hypothetical protein
MVPIGGGGDAQASWGMGLGFEMSWEPVHWTMIARV